MKLKIFALILLLVGCLLLGAVIGLPLLVQEGAQGAVTIIGGADWPTTQYLLDRLMHSVNGCLLLWGIALSLTGLFCLIFTKTVKTHCTVKTSAIALGASLVTAAGVTFGLILFSVAITVAAFGGASQYPVRVPVSVVMGTLCFLAFVGLMALYCRCRKEKRSAAGVVLDVVTGILYLPAFFYAGNALYEILGL